MLQNAYFLAKIGADTAENGQHFAEICQPTLSDVSAGCASDAEAYLVRSAGCTAACASHAQSW